VGRSLYVMNKGAFNSALYDGVFYVSLPDLGVLPSRPQGLLLESLHVPGRTRR